MDITPEMKARLDKFIVDKFPGGQLYCTVCLGKDVQTSNIIIELGKYTQGVLIISPGAVKIPLVPVICMTCGSVGFISAVIAGLVPGFTKNITPEKDKNKDAN